MNENLVSVWREAWRPPDRRPPWAWAEQHIGSIPYSPIPGRFRSDNSPQIREPLEALIDPRVRLVFIIAAIQSGKTSVGELGLATSSPTSPARRCGSTRPTTTRRTRRSRGCTNSSRIARR